MLWFIALIVVGAAVVLAVVAPAAGVVQRTESEDGYERNPGYEFDGSTADAETLARLGTPDGVAELVAQGRADELRGLGYQGELPGSTDP